LQKKSKKFILNIRVPAGCTATVHVPSIKAKKVKESNRKPKQLPEVTFLNEENGYAVFKVGSGEYQFTSRL